jgi:hypothetical protein
VGKSAKICRKYKLRDNRRAEHLVLQKNNFKNEINEWIEIVWSFNISIRSDKKEDNMVSTMK